MPTFSFSPRKSELQQLAEQYWQKAGEKEHELEKAAFEAGEAIRNGDYTLTNLEAIVRWKSERVVHYLIGNSSDKIRHALAVAASPESSTEAAVKALLELHGVDITVASAILAAIFPERYTVLDFRALEALGHARHDVTFTRSIWPSASAWPKATSSSRKATCPLPRRCAPSSARYGSGRAATASSPRAAQPTVPILDVFLYLRQGWGPLYTPDASTTRPLHCTITFVSNSFEIGPVQVGAGRLFLIAGPCVIESEAHARNMAEAIQRIAADLGIPYIFKASYDKANRTSVEELSRPRPHRGRAHPRPHRQRHRPAGAHRCARARPLRESPPKPSMSCRFPPSSAARPICWSPPAKPAAPSTSRRASLSLRGT